MKTRGERQFIHLPKFGAKLYDSFLFAEPIHSRIREVAGEISSKANCGPLLDIGTGPGRLLAEIYRLNPGLSLYGLDISANMIKLAGRNLASIPVNLRVGSIHHTDYQSGFFRTVVCVCSFYLWDYPEECMEEIFRILREGGSAYFYEVYRNLDKKAYRLGLRDNLRQLNLVPRCFGRLALRTAIKESYSTDELRRIIENTSFREDFMIERIRLSGVPMWVRISLTKNSLR